MNPDVFVGLSSFPSLNTFTSNIDFGFHIGEDRSICIYENDNLIKICTGEFTKYTVFSIQYNGRQLQYFIDGFFIFSRTIDLITPLHANFIIGTSGYSIENIHFDPLLIGSVGHTGDKGSDGLDGSTGSSGKDGVDGQRGSDGDTGYTGYTGSSGSTGSSGDTGYTGSTGSSGSTGSTGDTGSTGYTGSSGSTGSTGDTGSTGYTGSRGSTGSSGDTGSTGYTGSRGGSGSTGDTGSRGNTGSTGTTGKAGSTGFTGSTGTSGGTGSTGYTGSTGHTGSTGSIGSTGSTGIFGRGTFTLIPSDPTFITILDSATFTKQHSVGWTSNAYSVESFPLCNLTFTVNQLGSKAYGGFSVAPWRTPDISVMNYGFLIDENNLIHIYESGRNINLCNVSVNSRAVLGVRYDGRAINYYVNGYLLYQTRVVLCDPLYAVLSLFNPGYTIDNIHFDPLVKGIDGATGPPGQGVPSGGLPGQILAKISRNDYDTKWIDISELPRQRHLEDAVGSLIAKMKELMKTVNILESRQCTLLEHRSFDGSECGSFSDIDSAINECMDGLSLSSSDSSHSYFNVSVTFDCGFAPTDYSNGPSVDCGYGKNLVQTVVIRFDAGNSGSDMNSVSSCSSNKEKENEYIFDGGNSSTNYTRMPSINCGTAVDNTDQVCQTTNTGHTGNTCNIQFPWSINNNYIE
jgi:hypothetical protein